MKQRFRGTGIIYQDFKFDPTLYIDENDDFVFAQWSYSYEEIEIFGNVWKQDCKTDQDYVDRLIQIINHEVLHSVIEYTSDDSILQKHNIHFPYIHGFDDIWLKDQR